MANRTSFCLKLCIAEMLFIRFNLLNCVLLFKEIRACCDQAHSRSSRPLFVRCLTIIIIFFCVNNREADLEVRAKKLQMILVSHQKSILVHRALATMGFGRVKCICILALLQKKSSTSQIYHTSTLQQHFYFETSAFGLSLTVSLQNS